MNQLPLDNPHSPEAARLQWEANNRQLVELRARSPMRGKAGQHDTSDLALFRSADEPGLL